MNKRITKTEYCPVINKDVEIEILINEIKSGRGAKTEKIIQNPQCKNFKCQYRDNPNICVIPLISEQLKQWAIGTVQ